MLEMTSIPSTSPQRQVLFWKFIDSRVNGLVVELAEKILGIELEDHLMAGWNRRVPERRGYRNGYYTRRLVTPYGPVRLRVPRCRGGTFDPTILFDRYQRRVSDVDRVLRHAYLLGCSTRGVAKLLEQIFGGSVSHQTASRAMRWLDERLVQWRKSPIPAVYKVVYIDGMHVDINGGDRMVMLVGGQREPDGELEILDFSVGLGERCVELLASLRRRGLEGMELVVSDDAAAISNGLEDVFPEVSHQSCTFHRLQALRRAIGHTPERDAMVAEASNVFRCPSRPAAKETALAWANRWWSYSPLAVDGFMAGLSDSLMFYELPEIWWKRARTNNPMERQIRTLRMRLRPMGCFHNTAAIERAVFGQLLRWHKIKVTQHT